MMIKFDHITVPLCVGAIEVDMHGEVIGLAWDIGDTPTAHAGNEYNKQNECGGVCMHYGYGILGLLEVYNAYTSC